MSIRSIARAILGKSDFPCVAFRAGLCAGLLLPLALARPVQAADPQYHLKLGEISVATSLQGRIAQHFADEVAQKTNGQITMTVFPASQLGDETQLMQSAMAPTFKDINVLSNTILSNIDPTLAITNLPFLFRSDEQVGKFSGSPAFDAERDALLKSRNMRMLAAWDFPPENLYVNKPITSLADFKNFKLRVPPSKDFVTIFQTLGASPTPLAQTQTYLSLQTGIVEGTMGSDDAALAYKYTEVTKYDINLHYQIVFNNPVISERFYQSLSPALRKDLLDAAQESAVWGHAQMEAAAPTITQQMEKAGMKVLTVTDVDAWKAAVKPLFTDYASKFGDANLKLIDAIQ